MVNPLEVRDYLKKLNDEGFSAYIVGGYVRDYLLGKKSNDIDITTNALPKDVKKIFNLKTEDEFGSINIKEEQLNIDITTFRNEKNYINHRPQNITYVNNLKDDLLRRDFTINSICMDKQGEIIDLLNGLKDLEERKIKAIGNIKYKFEEDPLRMLRAIRMSIILNFDIGEEELKFILNNKHLFDTISFERKKMELEKILSSTNVVKGLNYLKTNNLEEAFNIKVPSSLRYSDNKLGMWAQLEFDQRYSFQKQDKKAINEIKEILKKRKIDAQIIFQYGFNITHIASWILGQENEFLKLYLNMPIHDIKELRIDGKDIKDTLCTKESKLINDIKDDIINKILSNDLNNDKEKIINYIIEHWK